MRCNSAACATKDHVSRLAALSNAATRDCRCRSGADHDRARPYPVARHCGPDGRLDAVAERLKTASEDKWRETSLSSSPLVIRLRESVEKLEKKIDRAKQAGKASEVSDLETQLATQREWLAQSERPAP